MRLLIKSLDLRYLSLTSRRMRAAWLILVISLLITASLWYHNKKDVMQGARQRFELSVSEAETATRGRLLAYELLLRGGAGLFDASRKVPDPVSRSEWRAYVKRLNTEQSYPGIQGIGFSKRILPSEKDVHILKIRAEGFPDYTIWPEGQRAEYTSIIYLEPFSGRNLRAFGYDMFSEPVRREAMERARDTGMTAVSGKVRLVQETEKDVQSGFLMYIPVYRNGVPINTEDERRAALAGYVYSPFRMNDLMRGILGKELPDIDMEIFDGRDVSEKTLMYDLDSRKRFNGQGGNSTFRSSRSIEAGGRIWTILFFSAPAFEATIDKEKPLIVLSTGILISLLFFAVVASLATTRERAITLANNMTEALRDSEKRYRVLFNGGGDAVFVMPATPDGDGDKFIEVNDVACSRLGYTRKELLGMTPREINDPDVFSGNRAVIEKLLAEKHTLFKRVHVAKDGRKIPVEINAHLFDLNGKPAILGIARDLTERKQAEEALRLSAEANLHLQAKMLHGQKLESLGVLAGGIAHDFNNLLMSILGNAEIALINLTDGSPARESIKKIKEIVHRAAELTRQMLAYSGKGKFVIENVDLSELVEDMTELLKVSIKKSIKIEYDLTRGLPSVEADATQIRQVVMNLIINASDAIGDTPGVIAISTGVMECDRECLDNAEIGKELPEMTCAYIDITDNGCGMDEETKAKIFDPFFTTKFTGRGLGLAAVLGIMRGHRGALKVYSKPGEGTTFRVLLPKSDKYIGTSPVADKKVEDLQGRGTILLVDDEVEILSVTRMMMEGKGFSVLTAKDGREGVELFRRHAGEIKAVLLDLTMPDMNGESAFLEMKKIRSDVKAILSSGYNEEEVSSKFDGDGFAGFLQKPYTLTELLSKVGEILG